MARCSGSLHMLPQSLDDVVYAHRQGIWYSFRRRFQSAFTVAITCQPWTIGPARESTSSSVSRFTPPGIPSRTKRSCNGYRHVPLNHTTHPIFQLPVLRSYLHACGALRTFFPDYLWTMSGLDPDWRPR